MSSNFCVLRVAFFLCSTLIVVDAFGYRGYGEECDPTIHYTTNSNQQLYRYPSVGIDGVTPSSYPYALGRQASQSQYPSSSNNQLIASNVPIDESRRCISERGFRCDEYTRRCKCHDLAGATYIPDHNRCELPIDTFCTTRGLDYAHVCVSNAECTCNWSNFDRRKWFPCNKPPNEKLAFNSDGRCKCKLGYREYEDKSGCWYSKGSINGTNNLVLLISLLSFVVVFINFKL